jgi:hypothetical protein
MTAECAKRYSVDCLTYHSTPYASSSRPTHGRAAVYAQICMVLDTSN